MDADVTGTFRFLFDACRVRPRELSPVHIGAHESGFFIEDNGPEIARKKREELLSDSTASSEHTHIGFTIVRDVVAAHNWKLTLADVESGGFRLEIATE
jgi:signal transduction histidine kinase